MRRLRSNTRIVVAAVLAAALVITFAGYAIGRGLGAPDIPSDAVAVVDDAPDGTITKADFDAGVKQEAAIQGLDKVPAPSDQQYASLRDATMGDLLLSRWVRGEAEDRGITVTSTDLANYIKQQFGNNAKFRQEAKKASFSLPQARDRIETILLGNQIQNEILPQAPSVSQSEIESFYNANISQFQQPETRDVRQIFNKDQAKVEQAQALLSKDDSAQSWKKVAARFSADPATKDTGGLREGVTPGQSETTVDHEIFSAPEGQLVGPIKGADGYYLIEVEKITPATTTPLSEATKQIEQQLSQGKQQDIGSRFQMAFVGKWTSRTYCASGYVTDRCANFPQADACVGDDSGEQGDVAKTGCAAFVTPTTPVEPGKATVFPGQTAQNLPQGPIRPVGGQPSVIGPPGAPQAPGAAPPPAGTPPGG